MIEGSDEFLVGLLAVPYNVGGATPTSVRHQFLMVR